MADKYIGAHVTVRLRTGLQVTGFVGHIELSSHEMTLKEGTLWCGISLKLCIRPSLPKPSLLSVQLEFPGQPPLYTPIYGVVGADIADLQVLAEAKREPSKSTDSSGSTAGGGGATKRKKQQSGNNNANRAAAEQRRADTRHAKVRTTGSSCLAMMILQELEFRALSCQLNQHHPTVNVFVIERTLMVFAYCIR